jgi:FAD-linked oxidoreductase
MISRRRILASSILAGLSSLVPGGIIAADVKEKRAQIPWRNWSGALSSNPKARLAPASEEELVSMIQQSSGTIRPVGSGHSFTPLVPTDGNLLILDKLNGVVSHDEKSKQATLWAGTRLSNSGPQLDAIGQAMINLPDIDTQTIAGAISTSTHGTGKGLKSLSGYLTGLRLVTPSGEVMDLDANHESDLFHAARVSFGSLGIITQARFQNREPFRLRSKTWVEETESVLENFDESVESYEHYEMMPVCHSKYSLVIAHQETTDAITSAPEADDGGGEFLALVEATPVALRGALIDSLVDAVEPTEFVGKSYDGLTNLRFDRFNEMEYSVPVDAGPHCLREILSIIKQESIDVIIPLEYRIIEGDDSWLSMFSGDPRVSISIHRMAGHDYRHYFDIVEPIFWKYGGRPHWGKVHSLGAMELKEIYPRFDDFVRLQISIDPQGRMLNDHLRYLLGRSV